MNKTALGTIIGAALLGLVKSQGSSARRMSLDDFFKKKVGNQDQTFKIYFEYEYNALIKNMGSSTYYYGDFSKYIEMYIQRIKEIVGSFHNFIESDEVGTFQDGYYFTDDPYIIINDNGEVENVRMYSKQQMFHSWASSEKGKSIGIDYYTVRSMPLATWERVYFFILKSKLTFTSIPGFEEFTEEDIELLEERARRKHVIDLINSGNVFYDIDSEWSELFVEKLYELGDIGDISWDNSEWLWEDDSEFVELLDKIAKTKKRELLDFLNDWEYEIFPTDVDINWDKYEHLTVQGYLQVRLDLETMNIPFSTWSGFIETIIENGYRSWISQKHKDATQNIDITIRKVEPDIWAKEKSNLRKR
jgi:hypothetical protein